MPLDWVGGGSKELIVTILFGNGPLSPKTISGPFYKVFFTKGPPNDYGFKPDWSAKESWIYRQAPPYDRPLPYQSQVWRILSFSPGWLNPNETVQYYNISEHPDTGGASTYAYNKAYDRFREAVGKTAELSVSLAERKQVMGMMGDRILQIANFVASLKKGNFKRAAAVLGVGPKQLRGLTLGKGAKSVANNYLEFHFGWSPLVADIGNAIEVLQSPVPPHRAHASAMEVRDLHLFQGNPEGEWYLNKVRTEVRWRIASDIAVTNPNLWLANSLGFVNPGKIAWELVPFSFVVDWFVNVSEVLDSFTDWYGLELYNPTRTRHQHSTHVHSSYRGYAYTGEVHRFYRLTGIIPGPDLRVRRPWTLSPRRGAAAASLLVQQLKSIK